MVQGKVKKPQTLKKARKQPYKKKQDLKSSVVHGGKQRPGSRSKANKKLSAAIDRKIEAIMTARILKAGGTVSIVEKPKDLDELDRAGAPRFGSKTQKKKKYGEMSAAHKKDKKMEAKKAGAQAGAVATTSSSSKLAF